MASSFSTLGNKLQRLLTSPKESDFWEADHVQATCLWCMPTAHAHGTCLWPLGHTLWDRPQAVAEGGGESTLENFSTLCRPCHLKKTQAQARREVNRKRQRLATGTSSLEAFGFRAQCDSQSDSPSEARR